MLRTRYACRTFGAALSGRLSYGMVSLSLVLAVKETTGSYAVAGTVMGLFGLTSVFLSPTRAGLVDRYGPRRALPPMGAAYALALSGLAFAALWSDASRVLMGLLAAAAGSSAPPLGPVMRTVWSNLVPDRRMLQRAYSLDSVAEELLFVAGPLLAGLLGRVTAPSVGLAVSAALMLVGSLFLVSSPAVLPEVDRGESLSRQGLSKELVSTVEPAALQRLSVRSSPDLCRAIAVSAGVGVCLGAFDLLVIAFADEHHAPETVAWILASLSAGSAVGGLLYGAVSWRASRVQRLSILAAALGTSLATAGLSSHVSVLIAWAALCGLFVAPVMTTAYLIADESAGSDTRTRVGAWVNTACNAGSAGATAATGLLLGRLPLPVCFMLAAAPAVLSAASALNRATGSASAAVALTDQEGT
ncbi:MFS transporter [Streptomyces sp. NBC_01077]|uniref:MFS transporter n=1 Tax=Streptomyces sp. NBC_01077 TaxID=2903746 RepID=UPI00386DF47A|nr:MFS transporter [Streptomyces sp. NBC_01077]WSV43720.1 MFS transporter [Streptomyces sp. NBC_01077]